MTFIFSDISLVLKQKKVSSIRLINHKLSGRENFVQSISCKVAGNSELGKVRLFMDKLRQLRYK